MACIFYNMPYVFFGMVQEHKKTGFRGWKNKNKNRPQCDRFLCTPERHVFVIFIEIFRNP